MDLGAVIALAGAAVAGVFTAQLTRQYLTRRRGHALAWALALGLYAVGMVALAGGLGWAWTPLTFGIYWGAGALLNVALLAVGQLLLLDGARAPLWWTLGALATVWTMAALVLSPQDGGALAAASAEATIPAGEAVFGSQALAWTILRPVTFTSFLVVLVGAAWSGVRHRRPGVLLIALGVGVAATSSAFLRAELEMLVPVSLTAGVAIMYAGFRSASKAPRSSRQQRRTEPGVAASVPGGGAGGSTRAGA